jgi:coproporphyrinogen III oxidase
LFFDYCKATEEMSMENWFNFVSEVGIVSCRLMLQLLKKKNLPYTAEQEHGNPSRSLCRVQFGLLGNFVCLKTNGRIESILMGLPPHVLGMQSSCMKREVKKKVNKCTRNPVDWLI